MRLPDKRYERIKARVVRLFQETNLKTIPVDAWSLAKKLDIKLISYSALTEEQREAALRLCDGALKFRQRGASGASHQVIIYDDSVTLGRQRFSILHEIGHIVLGHKQDSELADAEADFFAKYAIAPPMLVHVIKPSDYLDIAQAFGLSYECAFNSMVYYNKWLCVPGFTSYEHCLIELFTIETAGGDRVLRMNRSA